VGQDQDFGLICACNIVNISIQTKEPADRKMATQNKRTVGREDELGGALCLAKH
jgi:hypothetical protein